MALSVVEVRNNGLFKEIKIAIQYKNEDPGITAPRKSSVLIKFLFSLVTFMTSRRIFLKKFLSLLKKSLNDVKRRKSGARACHTGESQRQPCSSEFVVNVGTCANELARKHLIFKFPCF